MLTAVTVDGIDAVYSELPDTLGLQLGMVRQVPNTNKFVQLVQCYSSAAASLKVNGLLKIQGTAFTSPVVDMSGATTDFIIGVNDNAGIVIPAGYYFWMTIAGPCTILTNNGATAGKFQTGHATAGTSDDASAYQVTATNNLLLLASNATGGVASRAALLLGGA